MYGFRRPMRKRDDFDLDAEEEALEAKADAKLHAIHNGDERCYICGNPSYSLQGRNIVCKLHMKKV
jgi:hypothetical protein